MSSDFLSRWSRLKRQAKEAPKPEPAAPEPDGAEAEETLSPEELALLPSLDDLTPDMDLTAFLRQGVPAGLRKAAMRRMWSLDPAIRDYLSEAREYAYDWNVPGGVPGMEPLRATDNVEAMLSGMFGPRGEARSPAVPPPAPAEAASPAPMSEPETPLEDARVEVAATNAGEDAKPDGADASAASLRHHGGATPI